MVNGDHSKLLFLCQEYKYSLKLHEIRLLKNLLQCQEPHTVNFFQDSIEIIILQKSYKNR